MPFTPAPNSQHPSAGPFDLRRRSLCRLADVQSSWCHRPDRHGHRADWRWHRIHRSRGPHRKHRTSRQRGCRWPDRSVVKATNTRFGGGATIGDVFGAYLAAGFLGTTMPSGATGPLPTLSGPTGSLGHTGPPLGPTGPASTTTGPTGVTGGQRTGRTCRTGSLGVPASSAQTAQGAQGKALGNRVNGQPH